jgi:hypothetical protein
MNETKPARSDFLSNGKGLVYLAIVTAGKMQRLQQNILNTWKPLYSWSVLKLALR